MGEQPSIVHPDDGGGGDWIKAGAWDIPANDLDELLTFLAAGGTSPEQFKTWPLYRWHVGKPGFEWLAEL